VDPTDDDEERYSRQVYALGSRAHSLIRTSTILLDGPPASGLLWECAKNLALSGVGHMILLKDDVNHDMPDESTNHKDTTRETRIIVPQKAYHNEALDDLGNAYKNAARAETESSSSANNTQNGKKTTDEKVSDLELLREYITRLNPSVQVSTMTRAEFLELGERQLLEQETNPVFLCVDRPQSIQILLNDACRKIHGRAQSSDDELEAPSMVPFVSVETAGVYSRAFCDFGPSFVVADEDGETPKPTLVQQLESTEEEGILLVRCVEGERHDVSRGDQIVFQGGGTQQSGCEGSECQIVKVHTPTRFTIKRMRESCSDDSSVDAFMEEMNANAKTFTRVKVPRKVSFIPLSQAITKDPSQPEGSDLFAASDLDKSFDLTRRCAVMASFASLDAFTAKYGRMPNSKSGHRDFKRFTRLLFQEKGRFSDNSSTCKENELDAEWNQFASTFSRCCAAKLAPVQALIGAIGSQEVLKAASSLYNPIRQFLLFDSDELLLHKQDAEPDEDDSEQFDSAPGLCYILGRDIAEKFRSQRLFVVGSGAIGCELLKNLAAMGAGTGGANGAIILTDMDTIEKSNLSRQLLFRDSDVGRFKAEAAREGTHRFNPKMKIEAHASKVGDDTGGQGPFTDAFWSDGFDVILNALDNIEARLYMDSQCVAQRKGLIDAGTLGPKGNMQVVVPHKSESYGSSSDPPEPAIPVCTLKNFPYEISHTIQWARDIFDGLFNRRPTQANDNSKLLSELDPTQFAKDLVHKLGDTAAVDAAIEMNEELSMENELITSSKVSGDLFLQRLRKLSLEWAATLADTLFRVSVEELLDQHPVDSVDEDGENFWSGTRSPPKALRYKSPEALDSNEDVIHQNLVNSHILEFVKTVARLRAETFLAESILSESEVKAASRFSDSDAASALTAHTELIGKRDPKGGIEKSKNVVSLVRQKLDGTYSADTSLNVVEFEKDDESNGHVAFATAASNLRAISYGIPPVDAMETRRIAGRIIPAMITTTAFVSALPCLELIKLVQKAPLSLHRNAYINLALPFFAFTSPVPADEYPGLNGKTFTLWDRIMIAESKKSLAKGGLTMKRFLRQVIKKAGGDKESTQISSVSYGPFMIYANFLHEDDDSVLDKHMWDLLKEAITSGDDDDFFAEEDESPATDMIADLSDDQKEKIAELEKKSFLDLSVIVEDVETGEEIQLPTVRISKYEK